MPLAIVQAAAMLAVWALAAASAPAAAPRPPRWSQGWLPAAGALLRSRLPRWSATRSRCGAYALDSVGIEVSFVTGPLITAVVVALAGPGSRSGSRRGWCLGTALFLAHLPAPATAGRARPRTAGGSGRSPTGIRIVALSTVPVGFCIGAIEVAIPAFSDGKARPRWPACCSRSGRRPAGSAGWSSAPARPRPIVDTFLLLAVLFPLACLPLALAWSPAAMAVLVVFAGLPIAPLIASRNRVVGKLAPGSAGPSHLPGC